MRDLEIEYCKVRREARAVHFGHQVKEAVSRLWGAVKGFELAT